MLLNHLSGAGIELQQILYQIRMLVVQIHKMSQFSEILKLIVSEARTILESDRVVIYRFLADGGGVVQEESATPEWMPIIQGQLNYDPCFGSDWVEQYQAGRVGVIEDINTQELDTSYKELLTRLQIRAKLVVPILVNNQHSQELDENPSSSSHLWGLLIAHQCSTPRQWNPLEIEFLQLLSAELGFVIQQTQRYDKLLQLYQTLKDSSVQPNHECKQLEKSLLLTDYSFECIGISGTWIDRNAKILRVNEAACRLLGYSRAELESMYVYQLDPDFPKQAWAAHWQELKQQKYMNFNSQHRRKDGQLVPVEVTLNYVEFDGEEYNFAFARDISEQQAALHQRIQAETALRESEERYRSVITAMAEGIVLQQADGRIIACNQSAERILGLTSDQIMGCTSIDAQWRAIHEDGSPFSGESHPSCVTLQTGQPQFNVIMGVYKTDCSLTWVSVNSQPLFKPDQLTPYAVVTSFTDITDLKEAQQALQKRMEQERMIYAISAHIRQSLDLEQILNTTVAEIRQFLQSDRVIIYRFNPDGSGVVVTESVAQHEQPLLNLKITDNYFIQTHQQHSIQAISDIYNSGLTPSYIQLLSQLQVRAKLVVPILQSHHLWGLLVVHHCRSPRQWQPQESELLQQLATQLALAIQQSELYQQLQTANGQLQNLAMVDQLTQLANRRCFDQKLDDLWQHLLREQNCISLLLCDIDFFKRYNDTYGHAAGDDCLRLVAQAFQQTVKRSTDLVARYGGEEFVIVLTNTEAKGAVQVAQKIHQAVQKLNIPHIASDVKPYVTLSIGIATLIPTSTTVPLDLIEAADQALYEAKAQGRNCSLLSPISITPPN